MQQEQELPPRRGQLRDCVGGAAGRSSERGQRQDGHHERREDQQVYLGLLKVGKLRSWSLGSPLLSEGDRSKGGGSQRGPHPEGRRRGGGASRKESAVTLKPPSSCSSASCSWGDRGQEAAWSSPQVQTRFLSSPNHQQLKSLGCLPNRGELTWPVQLYK